MPRPWSIEFIRLALMLIGFWGVGLLVGQPGLLLVAGLITYLLWNLHNLRRLELWLREGRHYHPPEASGIWDEVFHLFYQVQQRARQRKRRLANILAEFQDATEAMPDATVVLGPHNEIRWFNTAAMQMLDFNTGQDVGQRIDNLIRYPVFNDFLDHGNEQGYVLIPAPVDESVTLSVRVVPYGSEQRLLILRDVSQQQRLEQMRRDFVANVSHELRTPLTVVAGFVETMQDDDTEFAQQWGHSLELMQQQTKRMQSIVEDLLLLSRLETDRNRPPTEPVAVPAILATVREDAEQLSADKRHTVTLEADSELGLLGADRELHSAFANLVTNAVRYTPQNGSIHIKWWEDERGAHYSVTDSGIGIERHHIPRLTERFYRVDVGRSRDSGGTGLGLAIVKHVLNRHDGKLRIDSSPGRGSTFTIDFPKSRIYRNDAKSPSNQT